VAVVSLPHSQKTESQSAIRVAQILVGRTFGGAERYVLELSRYLRARGHQVSFILPPDSVLREPLATECFPVAWTAIRGDIHPMTPLRVARAVRQHNIHLLNIHDNGAAVPCTLGGQLAGIPVVATVHAFHSRWPFIAANHLITVSDCLREQMIAEGLPAQRITTVRSGVDLSVFQPQSVQEARAALHLSPEAFYFVSVGRLNPGKRLDLLIDAMHPLVATYPHARLLLVGEGEYGAKLRAQVHHLCLQEHVFFQGFHADMRPVYAAADCLVSSSAREGLGLTILEAMAMERAVISTDAGGPRELVRDGETGRLIPVDDGQALLTAMRDALDNPSWLHEAGLRGRAVAEREHDIRRQIDGVEAVYQRLLAQSAGTIFRDRHYFPGKINAGQEAGTSPPSPKRNTPDF